MAFQIIKENTENIWRHSNSENTSNDFIISSGWLDGVDDKFYINSNVGAAQSAAFLVDIEVIDASVGGSAETFATMLELVTRLKALEYPYF